MLLAFYAAAAGLVLSHSLSFCSHIICDSRSLLICSVMSVSPPSGVVLPFLTRASSRSVVRCTHFHDPSSVHFPFSGPISSHLTFVVVVVRTEMCTASAVAGFYEEPEEEMRKRRKWREKRKVEEREMDGRGKEIERRLQIRLGGCMRPNHLQVHLRTRPHGAKQ